VPVNPTESAESVGDEIDLIVREILRTFGLRVPKSTRWGPRLADLRRVLQVDYQTPVRRFVQEGRLPLQELRARAKAVFPGFDSVPLGFMENLGRIGDNSRGLGLKLRLSGYGKMGHPLRGFYHQQADQRPLIWVNVRHLPAAVAATLAHELGHYFWNEIHSDWGSSTRPFYNAGFGSHLKDPRELFADAFATLAAYPRPVARQLFSPRGWPRNLKAARILEHSAVTQVHEHLRRHYDLDLRPSGGLPVARRFYYLTSMIHFSKLRAAILNTVGI
jgi:hypothetical protein